MPNRKYLWLIDSPFAFDYDRWLELKSCGLFQNLSAKSFINDDGGVALEIKGFELPAIVFSPEATFVASLSHPEAAGGVI